MQNLHSPKTRPHASPFLAKMAISFCLEVSVTYGKKNICRIEYILTAEIDFA